MKSTRVLLVAAGLLLLGLLLFSWPARRSEAGREAEKLLAEIGRIDAAAAAIGRADAQISQVLERAVAEHAQAMLEQNHAAANKALREINVAVLGATTPAQLPDELTESLLSALAKAHHVHFHAIVAELAAGRALTENERAAYDSFREAIGKSGELAAGIRRTTAADPAFSLSAAEHVVQLNRRILAGDLDGFNVALGKALSLVIDPRFALSEDQRSGIWAAGATLHISLNDAYGKFQNVVVRRVPACPQVDLKPIPPTPVPDSCCGLELNAAPGNDPGNQPRCLHRLKSTCIATFEAGLHCKPEGSGTC